MAETITARAKALLRRTDGQGVLVGVSGKDSLAVLDLCCSIFPRVEGFFWYLVRDLSFDRKRIEWVERRYGIVVHQVPHIILIEALKNGYFGPQYRGGDRILLPKQRDTENVLRARTGLNWIAYGHRVTDSLERRAMLKQNLGLDEPGRRVYPVWDWSEKTVYSYLRLRGIPNPKQFSGVKTSGAVLDETTIAKCRRDFPEDYEKIRSVFPYVDTLTERANAKNRASAVRDADDVPSGDPRGRMES